jgi:hypothetical protein
VIPEIDRIRTIAQIAAYDTVRCAKRVSVQDCRDVVEHIDAQAARITELETALRLTRKCLWLEGRVPFKRERACVTARIDALLASPETKPSWPLITEGGES